MTCSLPRLSRCSTSPASSQVTVCRPLCGCGPMSRPEVSVTGAGPMWSAKHQGPTVRRSRRGRARRTGIRPTSAIRLAVISTQAGATALARGSAGGASTVATGPLMRSTVGGRAGRCPAGPRPARLRARLAWNSMGRQPIRQREQRHGDHSDARPRRRPGRPGRDVHHRRGRRHAGARPPDDQGGRAGRPPRPRAGRPRQRRRHAGCGHRPGPGAVAPPGRGRAGRHAGAHHPGRPPVLAARRPGRPPPAADPLLQERRPVRRRSAGAQPAVAPVTDRKPPGVGFQTWVERQIREAAERGAFDNLPGAGKPIEDLDKPHDELWWVKQKLRRENLSYLPPTIALRKEAEDALAAAAEAGSEAEVRRIVADINRKILEGNRKAASGPPLNLMPFDVERVVRSWRERRGALTPSGKPDEPDSKAGPFTPRGSPSVRRNDPSPAGAEGPPGGREPS